jgi:transcription initiation factor TFIIF subunit beta
LTCLHFTSPSLHCAALQATYNLTDVPPTLYITSKYNAYSKLAFQERAGLVVTISMFGPKMENGLKPDPDAHTPGFMDDDLYEDTGELNIPPDNSFPEFWLTRVPDWLVQSLDGLGDDDEIEIGKMAFRRTLTQEPGKRPEPQEHMKIILDPQGPVKNVPREYNVTAVVNADELNPDTYIFTEKDLPGYKPNAFGRMRTDIGGGYNANRVHKPRPKFRKAIPSMCFLKADLFHLDLTSHPTEHTSLVGTPRRILDCVPEDANGDTRLFLQKRNILATTGANEKTNIRDDEVHNFATGEQTSKAFKNFVNVGGKRKVRQENKAARIPKNELLDLLHKLFDRYEYWPMKEIKKTTAQPEAYLKEVLSEIAALVKSGPFASCWKRNTDLNTNAYSTVHDKPPESKSEDETGMDDEEDEMEDVV